MRFVFDTGAASDYVNRRGSVYAKARAKVARGHQIGIGAPALGELWGGIEYSESRDTNLKRLSRNLVDFTLWPYDVAASRIFGRVYAELRRKGRPMQQVDIQIAAIALNLGNSVVVTKDSDFTAIDGLAVADWSISE